MIRIIGVLLTTLRKGRPSDTANAAQGKDSEAKAKCAARSTSSPQTHGFDPLAGMQAVQAMQARCENT